MSSLIGKKKSDGFAVAVPNNIRALPEPPRMGRCEGHGAAEGPILQPWLLSGSVVLSLAAPPLRPGCEEEIGLRSA